MMVLIISYYLHYQMSQWGMYVKWVSERERETHFEVD